MTRVIVITHYMSVILLSGSEAPAMFPSNGWLTRRPPSLPRLQAGWPVRRLRRYYEALRLLPPLGPGSLGSRRTYHRLQPMRSLPPGSVPTRGPGAIAVRPPLKGRMIRWRRYRSPRFLGNPDEAVPASETPAGPPTQASTGRRRGPRLGRGEGLLRQTTLRG